MDHHVAQEIIACLPAGRTVFPYYRDRYGVGLLRQLCRREKSSQALNVAALKRSNYAPLLQKPRIKSVLSSLGHAALDEATLALHDYDPLQSHYLLTLSTWGHERRAGRHLRQTSRPGINLVLQLNFNAEHQRRFNKLGREDSLFNYTLHPVSDRYHTLAWARIDLDFDTNCALIEEVQSDWVRRVAWMSERVENRLANGQPESSPTRAYGLQCSLATAREYSAYVREQHTPLWAEAMLWASIQFIRDELGLNHIYYHSERGGTLIKGITGTPPPRSLYTDLPRRFCFTPTSEVPPLLAEDKEVRRVLRQHPDISFFKLS